MKIALVHNVPTGGAKRSLHDFVRGLVTHGHTVDLYQIGDEDAGFLPLKGLVNRPFSFEFRTWDNRLPSGLGLRSLAHYAIGLRNVLAIEKVYERMVQRIAQESLKEPYDLAYVAGCVVSGVPSVMRHLQIHSLCYCQEPPRWGAERSYGWGQRLKNLLLLPFARAYFGWFSRRARRNLGAAKKILVNSRYIQERMTRQWGLETQVCYHGIDLEVFRPTGAKRRDYVLSVGALYPHKGFDFLVRSLRLLEPANRPTLVLVCDRGTQREEIFLRRLAETSGVRLEVHWCVSQEALLRFYNEARLFLYAPHQEPFGLAPLEAMACGTPVVAVGEGGVLETVGGESGGILTPRRESEFAQRVGEILSDEKLWRAYSAKGLDWVRGHWSLQDAQERFECIARDVAGVGCP